MPDLPIPPQRRFKDSRSFAAKFSQLRRRALHLLRGRVLDGFSLAAAVALPSLQVRSALCSFPSRPNSPVTGPRRPRRPYQIRRRHDSWWSAGALWHSRYVPSSRLLLASGSRHPFLLAAAAAH